MKVVLGAGILLLMVVVLLAGMMTPDTTEASILSWIANKAEDSKRAAVMNSVEMRMAEQEIEELRTQLVMFETACPSLVGKADDTMKAGVFGWLPWK
jgi:hypothetical protein